MTGSLRGMLSIFAKNSSRLGPCFDAFKHNRNILALLPEVPSSAERVVTPLRRFQRSLIVQRSVAYK